VTAVQIDAIKRQVYVKFDDPTYTAEIVQHTNGSVSCKHATGEISTVQIDMAGLGLKRVWVVNVPLDVGQERFQVALMPYGEVKSVQEEQWHIPLCCGEWGAGCVYSVEAAYTLPSTNCKSPSIEVL
jgi:hypothetical protein